MLIAHHPSNAVQNQYPNSQHVGCVIAGVLNSDKCIFKMLPIKEETKITSKLFLAYVFLKSWLSVNINVGVWQGCRCMGGSCKQPIVDEVKQRIPLFITLKVHVGLNPSRHPQTHKKPSESLCYLYTMCVHIFPLWRSISQCNLSVTHSHKRAQTHQTYLLGTYSAHEYLIQQEIVNTSKRTKWIPRCNFGWRNLRSCGQERF